MRIVAALGLASFVGACSMAESSLIVPGAGKAHGLLPAADGSGAYYDHARRQNGAEAGAPIHCSSDLGAYYLSRGLIVAKVQKLAESGATTTSDTTVTDPPATIDRAARHIPHKLTVSGPEYIPDTGKGYCLDFLANPTSHDLINVKRNAHGLLSSVSSLADDQSVEIAKRLIDLVFVGISGAVDPLAAMRARENASEENWETVLEVRYDPMVPMQTALLNERLKDFGFCLILAEEPPLQKREYPEYCTDPMDYLASRGLNDDAFLDEPPAQEARAEDGIFYRPRRPYSYYVLQLENRKVLDDWRLAHTSTVNLENRSPVLLVGTDRTFFAKRRTKLTFDQGSLRDIEVDKTSELLGFVEVPLYLAQNIVALPSAVIKVDINQSTSEAQLIGAELALIQKQNDMRSKLDEIRAIKRNRMSKAQ